MTLLRGRAETAEMIMSTACMFSDVEFSVLLVAELLLVADWFAESRKTGRSNVRFSSEKVTQTLLVLLRSYKVSERPSFFVKIGIVMGQKGFRVSL